MNNAILVVLVLLSTLGIADTSENSSPYDGMMLVNIGPVTADDHLPELVDWIKGNEEVQRISASRKVGRYVSLLVGASMRDQALQWIQARGINYFIETEDFGSLISENSRENEKARETSLKRRKRRRRHVNKKWEDTWGSDSSSSSGGISDNSKLGWSHWISPPNYYMKLNEMNAWMKRMSVISKKTKLLTIGTTQNHKPIKMLAVNDDNRELPAIWINAGVHAREWVTHSTAIHFIHKFVFSNDELSIFLRKHFRLYVVPNANPDGYEHTWKKDRLWRKNRNDNNGSECKGVDINRNFVSNFMRVEQLNPGSNDPCSHVHHGSHPFSEPEAQALVAAIESLDISLAFDLHSFSQLWLIPYGDYKLADNYLELMHLSKTAVKAIEQFSGVRYEIGQSFMHLYPVAGTFPDWVHEQSKVKLIFNPELRPAKEVGLKGFILPTSSIAPIGEEVYRAIFATCKEYLFGYYSNNGAYTTTRPKSNVTRPRPPPPPPPTAGTGQL